ncbi:MAG: FkbM family methyltransferase [Paracoccaceae bacterium]
MNAPARGIVVPQVIAVCHGIEVPQAPHIGRRMIESMAAGRFERSEIDCGLAAIKPGARILEMGAGSGLVGAVLARNCAPLAMLSIEANPNLIPHITALYAHNNLTNLISVRNAVVLTAPETPKSVTFHITGNFLGSGLASESNKTCPVDVPVVRYADLTATFPHDTIMMDIEGGELDFLRHADLSGVHTFIAEMHRNIFGREGMRECRQLLAKAGLMMNAELSKSGVHVYQRQS